MVPNLRSVSESITSELEETHALTIRLNLPLVRNWLEKRHKVLLTPLQCSCYFLENHVIRYMKPFLYDPTEIHTYFFITGLVTKF
jgi:hypothetical protein